MKDRSISHRVLSVTVSYVWISYTHERSGKDDRANRGPKPYFFLDDVFTGYIFFVNYDLV